MLDTVQSSHELKLAWRRSRLHTRSSTYGFLATAEAECRASGEHLAGLYLPAPDLFVRRLDRATIERALADWLDRDGGIPAHLRSDLDEA